MSIQDRIDEYTRLQRLGQLIENIFGNCLKDYEGGRCVWNYSDEDVRDLKYALASILAEEVD